jgi:hypothetical protein
MKILPVGAELFSADGLPDMTKLIVVFDNFTNAPNKRNETLDINVLFDFLYKFCPKNFSFQEELSEI